jgi:hypothetical protein
MSFWKNVFSLDMRSLALWRFALGVCLILDVAYRLKDGVVFYTDDGQFAPRSIAPRLITRHYRCRSNRAM